MKKIYLKIIGVLLVINCNLFAQIPTDSLVAYYPFNGNANDSSGNGFNGILNGQYSVASTCKRAYYFSNNNIDCGDPTGNQFDLINNASISLWVALFSAPSSGPLPYNGYFTLIGKDVGPGNNEKWFLAITNNELTFHVNVPPSSGGWATQTIFPYALGTLYHIVVTKTNNTYKFYVNGVDYGSQTLSFNVVDVPFNLKIGDLHDGSTKINAVIDEVMIYRRVLTQTEINQLYAHCSSGIITSTGMVTRDQQGDLKIYPNPSSGKFVLYFNNVPVGLKTLFVYDILGKKIFAQSKIYDQRVAIDLRGQPKGSYFLQVQTGKKIMTKKIVLE